MRLWCLSAGIELPALEYRFSARQFAFDLAWPARKIAVEQEGGIYGRGKACPLCHRKPVGAHTSIERLKSDMEKYNLAACLGWRVIRVRPEETASGAAMAWLDAVILGKAAA